MRSHPVGVRMVELPHGHIVEQRRGGDGILASLIADMIKLESSGYIRCERTPKESVPRIGQIIFDNGNLSAAIHEEKAIYQGIEALIAIESDVLELDCKITVSEFDEISRVLELYPDSIIDVEKPPLCAKSKWLSAKYSNQVLLTFSTRSNHHCSTNLLHLCKNMVGRF